MSATSPTRSISTASSALARQHFAAGPGFSRRRRYEVIPVYSRRPFRLDAPARLQASLDGIRLALPAPASLASHRRAPGAPWDDQSIYLQVTRGADDKRDHAFPPAAVPPTVCAFASPLGTTPAAVRQAGVAAITWPTPAGSRCDDLKVVSLLANVPPASGRSTGRLRRGPVAPRRLPQEGAASNIFVVTDGVLSSPRPGPPHAARHHLRRGPRTGGPALSTEPRCGNRQAELRTADEV